MILKSNQIKQNDIEVLNMVGRTAVSFEAPIDKSIDDITFISKWIKGEYTRSSELKIKYISEEVYLEQLAKDPDNWKGVFHDNIRIICTDFKDEIKKKYKIDTFTVKDLSLRDKTYTTIFLDNSITDEYLENLAYDIIVQNIHIYLNDIGIKSFKYNDRYAHDILTCGRLSFEYSDEYTIALPEHISVPDAIFALSYYEAICEVFAQCFSNFSKSTLFNHFPKYIEPLNETIYNYADRVKDDRDTDEEYIRLLKDFYVLII